MPQSGPVAVGVSLPGWGGACAGVGASQAPRAALRLGAPLLRLCALALLLGGAAAGCPGAAAPGYSCAASVETQCPAGAYCAGGGAGAVPCMTPANCGAAGLSAEPPCVWNVTTLAGNGSTPFANGQGTAATFNEPSGVAADASGVVYVADYYNHRIRAVTPSGLVSALAGSGTSTWADGTGTSASFNGPSGVATYPGSGIIYVADSANNCIRKLTPSGVTTTFAGRNSTSWADGQGTSASFWSPSGLTVDSAGTVYVADLGNHRIRKITPLGAVTTLAGTGSYTPFSNGVGTSTATFNYPHGVAVDGSGNVYVGDSFNNRIRLILRNGTVSTLAGSGSGIWADGTGTLAAFRAPRLLFIAANGNLFIADYSYSRIRMTTPLGVVTTIAGGTTASFRDAAGTSSLFNAPFGITASSTGVIYASDSFNHRIRALSCLPSASTPTPTPTFNPISPPSPNSVPSTASSPSPSPNSIPSFTPSSTPSPTPSATPTPPTILCTPGTFNPGGYCTPCPSNTYQPSFGAISCLPCPSAQYSTPASLTCWPPGSYASPGASTPTQCPVNTYSTDTAATTIDSCLSCDAGSSSSARSTSCFDSSKGCPGGTFTASLLPLTCPNCAAGTFSASNASSCTICPTGLYSPPGTISCALCPQGSYCPSGVETPCPKGWYGLQPLQTDLYQGCAQCPSGSFQPGLRANSLASCSSCAPGSFPTQPGASNCTQCPSGTFNPLLGSISPYACQLCEIGTFSTLPGQSSCASYCPKGTIGTRAGGTSASDACSPCPLGAFASSTGSTECSDCPPGSFSDAPSASKCTPCPQGRYSNSAAATSFQNCTVCPQGTYGAAAGQTIAGCLPCPPGTASASLGATLLPQCIPCSPGAYSPFAGSSTCIPSPPGSYSGAAATSPTLCPLGKFSSLQGAALASQCSACPTGKTTTSTGATQDTQCLAIPYTCPAGQQPRALGATSSADCIPLACPPPLRPSLFSLNGSDALAALTSDSCLGCPAGSSGALPACSACSGTAFCPGLTSRALHNFSAASGSFSTACAPLSMLSGSSPLASPSSSSFSSSSTSTVFFGVPLPTTSSQSLLAWVVIFSWLFILAMLVAFSRTSESAAGCSALPLRALKAVDLFNMNHEVKDKFSPFKEATPLGGLFSLMGLTTLLTYAAYMLATWLQDNTLVQQSLATMGPSVWGELVGLPWVAPKTASSLGSLALRLTIDGNPGACAAPLSMTTTSLDSGAFVLQSTGDCGGSGVAQHTLTCPGCRYTSDTSVSLVFDYSCQSMLLEALGSRPSYPGPLSLSIISAPTARTAAPKPGALLSFVSWQLTPVLSVLWDNVTAANSAMGWYLADSKLTLAPFLTPPALNGSLSIIPTASSVTVTFALSLSSTYSATLLTQRVPITQLLANIVGLSGLLSFFGMSFGWFEAACAKKRKKEPEPASVQAGETAAFSIANPLIQSAPAAAEDAQGGALGAAGAPSRWIRVTDSEGDVWFLSEVDRSSSWVLPPGGAVVREERVA